MKNLYKKYTKIPLKFKIKHPLYTSVIATDIINENQWTNYDDFLLIKGVFKYGKINFI